MVATGKGFTGSQSVYVNGLEVLNTVKTANVIRAEIDVTPDETVQMVLGAANRAVKSKAIPNPAHLQINNVTLVSYEPATRLSPVAVLIVKLEGTGFSEWLESSAGRVTPISSSEALIRIENPGPVTPVVLRDRRTNFTAEAVITRPRSRARRVASP